MINLFSFFNAFSLIPFSCLSGNDTPQLNIAVLLLHLIMVCCDYSKAVISER